MILREDDRDALWRKNAKPQVGMAGLEYHVLQSAPNLLEGANG